MVRDTNGTFLYCDWNDHQWEEQYYGVKCKTCGLFFPYGQAPWDPEERDDFDEPYPDDSMEAIEDDPECE